MRPTVLPVFLVKGIIMREERQAAVLAITSAGSVVVKNVTGARHERSFKVDPEGLRRWSARKVPDGLVLDHGKLTVFRRGEPDQPTRLVRL